MASSLLRLVYQVRRTRSAAVMIISRTVYSHFSPNSKCCSNLGCRKMQTAGSAPPKMSPWLMLPPVPEAGGGGIVYKFYSLAEEKVLSIESESGSAAEFVGSSHGWIASFDRRDNKILISNPLTDRHISLPSLYNLPDIDMIHMNTRIGRGNVSKVVLSSSSPEEDQGCRALMTFGPTNRLAFCSPAQCAAADSEHSWTPIGNPFSDRDMVDEELECRIECAEVHEDLVYRERRRVFTSVTPCEFELDSFRYSDPRSSAVSMVLDWDPWSPTEDWGGECGVIIFNIKREIYKTSSTRDWVKKNMALLQDQCVQIPHIVYAEDSDEIYIALRFVMLLNPEDGKPVDRVPFCPYRGLGGYFLSKTVGFVVFKLGDNNMEIVDDLNGLAMFVGINHSFVLTASDFPELKPDSIYFTDSKRIERIYGRNDIGIFDYRNKSVAEVVSSDEIFDSDDAAPSPPGMVKPSPMWFTPCAIFG